MWSLGSRESDVRVGRYLMKLYRLLSIVSATDATTTSPFTISWVKLFTPVRSIPFDSRAMTTTPEPSDVLPPVLPRGLFRP